MKQVQISREKNRVCNGTSELPDCYLYVTAVGKVACMYASMYVVEAQVRVTALQTNLLHLPLDW